MVQAKDDLSAEVLAQLVEVGQWLNSTLDLDELLDFIIEAAADVLNAQEASILLADEGTEQLYFAASTEQDRHLLRDIPVPMESSIAGAVFRENRPVIVNNAQADPRHYEKVSEVMQRPVRSLVGVPMRVMDYRVIGVLEAINKREGEFTEADADALAILGSQAAIAIHNARLLDELQSGYSSLGELDRLKSAYVSLAAEILERPAEELLHQAERLFEQERGSRAQRAMAAEALRLRSLADDLANLELLDATARPIERDDVDVRALLAEVHAAARHYARVRDQDFTVAPGGGVLCARADRRRLRGALAKLTDHALAYTPEGGVVRVRAFAEGGEARVQVIDNGPGIWPGQEEAIFERMHQLEVDLTGKRGGMGMGLGLVREIVEMQGGRVWAESPGLGRGSVFTLTLPLADGAPAQ